jgi:hypothetical protein
MVEEHSDGHGSLFKGLYLQLIVRYLRVDTSALMRGIDEDRIKTDLKAQPVFVTT